MALSKNKIKYITSLQVKKYRQNNEKFLVEGTKIVQELLLQDVWPVEILCATADWLEEHSTLLFGQQLGDVEEITEKELKRISGLRTPNQVVAVVEMPDLQEPLSLPADRWMLYLDGIQDPGNLGTILRIADWFGFSAVLCSPETADVFNSKTIQASMGAFLRVPVRYLDFAELQSAYPYTRMYAAAMNGENVFQTDHSEPGIIIIGNEGNGIRPEILEAVEAHWTIPGGGGAESLNAAVACGILCAAVNSQV